MYVDIHHSKLNLGSWIRKNGNMRDPVEISASLRGAYDLLWDCAYQNFEAGYYNRYLAYPPETVLIYLSFIIIK
jgi:hypothetical protein